MDHSAIRPFRVAPLPLLRGMVPNGRDGMLLGRGSATGANV